MSDEETTSGVVQTAKNRNLVESMPLPGIITSNSSQHASPSNGEAHHAGSFYLPIKPFLTIDQQISHLEEIGIAVSDGPFARSALLDCNYYRLRAYWMTFERDGKIAPGTTFEDVWSIYVFD